MIDKKGMEKKESKFCVRLGFAIAIKIWSGMSNKIQIKYTIFGAYI